MELMLKKGEVLALVGENGAGKSTLMKILSGAYKKDSGSIIFDGKEVEIQSPIHSEELGDCNHISGTESDTENYRSRKCLSGKISGA